MPKKKKKIENEIVRTVVAEVKRTIFSKGMYYILEMTFTKHRDPKMIGTDFVVKGTVPFDVIKGDELEVVGNPVKRYNNFKDRDEWQLVIKSIRKTEKGDELQAKRILAKVKGIGEKKIELIIGELGPSKILKAIAKTSTILNQFDFLTPEQRVELRKVVKKVTEKDLVTAELLRFRVTDNQIGKMREFFKTNFNIHYIKNNVFDLTEVRGFGFLTVATIADAFGIPKTDIKRIKACAIYTIKQMTNNGDCYVESEDLSKKCYKTLNIAPNNEIVRNTIKGMIKDEELYTFKTNICEESNILPRPKQIDFKKREMQE